MCTLEKRNGLFILTITGDDEHRLNPTLLDSIRAALHQARTESESSSSPTALITTAQGKFFSNGYDLAWSLSDPTQTRALHMSRKLRALAADLISLPMPTIAAVTGHAAAGGFILALCHDYIAMRGDRGFLYMSEMDIKLKIPLWFVKLLRSKVGSARVVREVVMKAAKITAAEAVELGIVDLAVEGVAETVAAAESVGRQLVGRGWDGRVYAENRMTVLAEVLDSLGEDETVDDHGEKGNPAISRL